MMEAVRTSETSVDIHFTRQYIPEDNSEHHTRRRENLKSHTDFVSSSEEISEEKMDEIVRLYIKDNIAKVEGRSIQFHQN
jgi:hypothetical protein